jgi:hypothetical protein
MPHAADRKRVAVPDDRRGAEPALYMMQCVTCDAIGPDGPSKDRAERWPANVHQRSWPKHWRYRLITCHPYRITTEPP